MPGRNYSSASGYRYGFNGKEQDNDVKGEGNAYDFGERIYDPRIVRWHSTDNVIKAWLSPYQYAANNPVNFVDPDGNDEIHFYFITTKRKNKSFAHESDVSKTMVIKVIPKDGPDKFFHHEVTKVMNAEWENKEGRIYQQYVSGPETDNITEFYPRGKNFDGKRGFSRITTHASGWPIIGGIGPFRSSDDDFTTLGKIANKELIDYLEVKDPANYGGLGLNAAFTELAEGIQKASGLLLLLEGAPAIFKIGKEAFAARELAIAEGEVSGAHFFSRHGAQTTLQQQLQRATTGMTPDGVAGRAVASSRFLSNQLQLEAYKAAKAAYTPSMAGSGTVIDMGKTIGEGYLKGGGAVQTSTSVQVYFNNSGEIITMFPKIR